MARVGKLGSQEHREAAGLRRADQLFRIRAACRALEPRGERERRAEPTRQNSRRRADVAHADADGGNLAAANQFQQGFLQRTPRGRIATASSYQHFGLVPPTSGLINDLWSATTS